MSGHHANIEKWRLEQSVIRTRERRPDLYQEYLAKNEEIRKVLLDIARKEKIHVAMFETVLLQTDREFLKIYSDYALARSRK